MNKHKKDGLKKNDMNDSNGVIEEEKMNQKKDMEKSNEQMDYQREFYLYFSLYPKAEERLKRKVEFFICVIRECMAKYDDVEENPLPVINEVAMKYIGFLTKSVKDGSIRVSPYYHLNEWEIMKSMLFDITYQLDDLLLVWGDILWGAATMFENFVVDESGKSA